MMSPQIRISATIPAENLKQNFELIAKQGR